MAEEGGCIREYRQAKCREQETQHSFEMEAVVGSRVVGTERCRIAYFICLLGLEAEALLASLFQPRDVFFSHSPVGTRHPHTQCYIKAPVPELHEPMVRKE